MSGPRERTKTRRWLFPMALASVVPGLLIGAACDRPQDSTSCAYWTDRLARSGEIDVALKQVGDLKCKEAMPVLQQLFDQDLLIESVLQSVKQIDDPKAALPILKAAMLKPQTTRQATTLALEWKLAEIKPELVKILSDDKLMLARDLALPGLLGLDAARNHEDLLVQLALADADKQPVEINRQAIRELGLLASKKAVPALVKAVYLRTVKGQEVFTAARHALAEVGDASVVTELLSVMAGTNEEINAYAKAQGLQPWELPATPKTAQILADSLDPRVVEPFIADIAAEIVPPTEISDRDFARWSADKSNRLKVETFALGHIGSETGLAALAKILRDGTKDTLRQRINAANALATIGTEAAQDVLISAWKDEILEILRAALLQIVAMGVDDRRLAAWDEMLGIIPEGKPKPKKPIELSETLKQALEDNERVRTYIEVTRKCMGDVACWIEKTKSENQDEQVKALLVLGRGRFGVSDAIKEALWAALENAPKALVDTKRYALMGLTRLGNQADGARMVKKGIELAPTDAYWGEELFSFGRGLEKRMLR